MRNRLLLFLLILALLASCGDAPLTFSGEEAYRQAAAQTALGPRPTGSEAGWATGDYITAQLKEMGWETQEQVTEFQGVRLRNIVGRAGKGPVIIVGAHYDTRPHADLDPVNPDQWILGANDGASGVAVLLELARVLDKPALDNEVWLTFFDAEDRGNLDGWPFSVGASSMAENLAVIPQAVIVLDMVGDLDQRFYYERNSNPELLAELWNIAADLGYQDHFIPQTKWAIIDDHAPFAALGLPAADVIDFDYPAWHTAADTLEQISAESLERIGRVMEVYLER